jgi:prolyl-tRNA synthetase
MFADADLVGAPIRAIVSPRNVQQGVVELKYSFSGAAEDLPTSLPLESAAEKIAEIARRAAAK